MKKYNYVGPDRILERVQDVFAGVRIRNVEDLSNYLDRFDFQGKEPVTLAYVVDISGVLRLRERNSEHVQIANGEKVLGAGEITVDSGSNRPGVIRITNLSTGYCPRPDSWEAVRESMARAGLDHPEDFTTIYSFRRCDNCNLLNVIKDDYFWCEACSSELSAEWNISGGTGIARQK